MFDAPRERALTVVERVSTSRVVDALRATDEIETISIIAAAAAGKQPLEVDRKHGLLAEAGVAPDDDDRLV